jgi:hypothetical protein
MMMLDEIDNNSFTRARKKPGVTVTPGVGCFQVRLGLINMVAPGEIIFLADTQFIAEARTFSIDRSWEYLSIKTRLI